MEGEVLSFQIRLVIARMARLVRKFDGVSTGLSRENEILELLRLASEHARPEVRSIYEEMLCLMNGEELRFLGERGFVLPRGYRARLQNSVDDNVDSGGRPKRVYRGHVMRD